MKNIRDKDPTWVSCDKDHTERLMNDGNIVKCDRYHCASPSHAPLIWCERVDVRAYADRTFRPRTCPWCKAELVKGGAPMELIEIWDPLMKKNKLVEPVLKGSC